MTKHCLPSLLLLALSAGTDAAPFAEPFDELLSTLDNVTLQGDSASFISHVQWQAKPEPATYQCNDWAGKPALTLERGEHSLVRTKWAEQAVIFGRNGDVEVFSITDEAGEPFFAAYLVLPSGETHQFRVGPGQKVVRESMVFQCETGATTQP